MIKNFTETSYIKIYDEIPEDIKLSDSEFDSLWKQHPKEYTTIKICGKDVLLPRYNKTYLKNYRYSGQEQQCTEELPLEIQKIFDWAKTITPELNSVLVNWYEKKHYIGFHSDNTKPLIKNSDIYSFSFGETRTFIIQDKKTKNNDIFEVKNNSLIVMCGTLQDTHKHSIKKLGVKELRENKGNRISVTFRSQKL